MSLTQEKEVKIRKQNMKIYPFYQMLGYDVLFFYAIRVMFFSEVKHFTDSQILLSTTLYAVFLIIFQMPVTLIVTKIGKRNGTILGNVVLFFWSVLIMLVESFKGLIIAQLFFSIAYAFKSISESNLLSESIPESKVQNDIFTSIDKKGYSKYCFFSAITTAMAGYLYDVDPYIPMIFCCICIIFATIISFNFTDIEKVKQKHNKEAQEIKKYLKELKKGFKFTVISKRLRALLVFTGTIWGIIALLEIFELVLLQYLGVSSWIIGIVFAILELTKGIFSRGALKFNKMFKNKSLINILASFVFAFALIGTVSIINIPIKIKMIIIITLLIILAALDSIYQILAKKYFNNFTNNKILPSIYSVKTISDNIFRITSTLLGSVLLNFVKIDFAFVILGVVLLIATILIYNYTKDKLGLDPENYTQKDIYIRR